MQIDLPKQFCAPSSIFRIPTLVCAQDSFMVLALKALGDASRRSGLSRASVTATQSGSATWIIAQRELCSLVFKPELMEKTST